MPAYSDHGPKAARLFEIPNATSRPALCQELDPVYDRRPGHGGHALAAGGRLSRLR
jgi:hypothetical protein